MLRITRARCVALAIVVAFVASCKREERVFRVEPPHVSGVEVIPVTSFYAGGNPITENRDPTTMPAEMKNDYEENAYGLAEGKRLFSAMNCSGCHFHGGGGIGPPLMDDKWFYGGAPAQVYASIVQGRPNGMPSYKNKLPSHQVWQVAAYVRSMSGLASSSSTPGRSEQMFTGPPENSRAPMQPRNSSTPKSTEMPQ